MARTIRFLPAALLIFTGACSRESLVVQTPPHPSGWANSTTTQPNPLPVPPANFSGTLPKPLNQMTGKELSDFVDNLPRGRGMDAERKCKGFACFFGARVTVGIEAAADAMYLDDTNATTNGTIGAVATNKGKYTTDRYNFKPNGNGKKHTYAFIVYPRGTAGGATYVVEDILKDGSTYSHTTVLTGEFILCHHRVWWTQSQAAFQTCDGKMSRGVAGTGIVSAGFDLLAVPKALLALSKASLISYSADDTPGWISCSAGCCTFGSALEN